MFDERRNFYLDPNLTHELWQDVTPFLTMLSSRPRRTSHNDPDYKMFEHRSGWIAMSFKIADATPNAWPTTGAPGELVTNTIDTVTGLGDEAVGAHFIGLICEVYSDDNTTYKGVVRVHNFVSGSDLQFQALGNPESGTDVQGAVADNDNYYVIGHSSEEGDFAPEAYSDDLTIVYNSTQIFKTPVEVTGTLYATALRGYSNELARLRREKSMEHQIKVERSLLHGVRRGGTGMGDANDAFNAHGTGVNGKTVRTTMGLHAALRRYGTTSGDNQNKFTVTAATYAYDNFVDDTEKVFRNIPSSGSKIGYCGGAMLSFWSKLGTNGFMGNTGSTVQLGPWHRGEHGYDVRSLFTPHGRIDLVNAPVLRGRYNSTMIVVDPDHVELVEFRPDEFQVNIKTDNAYDGYKDQYMSDLGLGITMIETHSMWTLA